MHEHGVAIHNRVSVEQMFEHGVAVHDVDDGIHKGPQLRRRRAPDLGVCAGCVFVGGRGGREWGTWGKAQTVRPPLAKAAPAQQRQSMQGSRACCVRREAPPPAKAAPARQRQRMQEAAGALRAAPRRAAHPWGRRRSSRCATSPWRRACRTGASSRPGSCTCFTLEGACVKGGGVCGVVGVPYRSIVTPGMLYLF